MPKSLAAPGPVTSRAQLFGAISLPVGRCAFRQRVCLEGFAAIRCPCLASMRFSRVSIQPGGGQQMQTPDRQIDVELSRKRVGHGVPPKTMLGLHTSRWACGNIVRRPVQEALAPGPISWPRSLSVRLMRKSETPVIMASWTIGGLPAAAASMRARMGAQMRSSQSSQRAL